MKVVGRLIDLIDQYRPLFLARTRREKVLFAAFVAAIVLVWAGTLPARMGDEMRDMTLAREAVKRQNQWFIDRDRIEADYQRALESLNPELLPPRQEVVAKLQAQAQQSGLTPQIGNSTSTKRDRLTFHTINVSFDHVAYGKIAEFQRAVAAALPSVNLKTIVLSSRQGAADIGARLTYEAIEYTQ